MSQMIMNGRASRNRFRYVTGFNESHGEEPFTNDYIVWLDLWDQAWR